MRKRRWNEAVSYGSGIFILTHSLKPISGLERVVVLMGMLSGLGGIMKTILRVKG
jgi:hypothetical protein